MKSPPAPTIGYVPHGLELERPADRRRFPRYAAIRNIAFDIVSDWVEHDIIVLSPSADVTKWVNTPSNTQIIVDLPDAVLAERRGPKQTLRGLAKWVARETKRPVLDYTKAVRRLIERADAVACSTTEHAERIVNHNQNVHPITDLLGEIDLLPPRSRDSSRLNIVWEGQIATLHALRPVAEALNDLAGQFEIRLHLVTDLVAPRYMNRFLPLHTEEFVADWGIDVRVHQWNAGTLKQVAQECDLAIVPVDLTDSLARGKAENRMVIFWRLGLPVLASASPANIRAAARCGFEDKVICTTAEDWKRNLQDLLAQSGERLPIAMAGQTLALTDYSEESLAQRWDHLFESLR